MQQQHGNVEKKNKQTKNRKHFVYDFSALHDQLYKFIAVHNYIHSHSFTCVHTHWYNTHTSAHSKYQVQDINLCLEQIGFFARQKTRNNLIGCDSNWILCMTLGSSNPQIVGYQSLLIFWFWVKPFFLWAGKTKIKHQVKPEILSVVTCFIYWSKIDFFSWLYTALYLQLYLVINSIIDKDRKWYGSCNFFVNAWLTWCVLKLISFL